MEEASRTPWDEVWQGAASLFGSRSRCSLAKVGAVITTPDNRVVSQSYNGPAPFDPRIRDSECKHWCPRAMPDADRTPSYDACVAIHAEVNAILRASWDQCQGATIWVTHSMCINCAKVVAASGIKRVVHRVTEADAHRRPEVVESYLRGCLVDVTRWEDNDVQG